MDDYSSIILVAFVVMLFLIFGITQIRIGVNNLQKMEGSRIKNILRFTFAIPILIGAMIVVVLLLIYLVS